MNTDLAQEGDNHLNKDEELVKNTSVVDLNYEFSLWRPRQNRLFGHSNVITSADLIICWDLQFIGLIKTLSFW